MQATREQSAVELKAVVIRRSAAKAINIITKLFIAIMSRFK